MSSGNSNKSSFSVTGFLKLTRFPNLLIIAFTQYFAAIFLAAYPENWYHKIYDYHLFLLSLSTILIAAAGYIINDYYDIKIDYVNKPEKVVVGKLVKRRIVLVSHAVLNFAGIGIGLQPGHLFGQCFWHHTESYSPTSHGVSLREAVDDHNL